MRTDAYFSADRRYRYWLLRVWDESLPVNCACGVNPSVANERENDPTIRKDMGFSSRQGFGGLLKVNLSAFCSTDPKGARCHSVGEENSPAHIRHYYEQFGAKQFIACWGRNGNSFQAQAEALLREFPEALCFGCNPDGTPRHTLMLPYSTALRLFKEPAAKWCCEGDAEKHEHSPECRYYSENCFINSAPSGGEGLSQ